MKGPSLLPPPYLFQLSTGEPTEVLYSCTRCKLNLYSLHELNLHQASESVNKERTESADSLYLCPTCNIEFASYLGMRQHYGKVHNKDRTARCSICSNRFKDIYALKFHKRQVHEKSTQIYCTLCNKSLYNKYSYNAHLKKCRIYILP